MVPLACWYHSLIDYVKLYNKVKTLYKERKLGNRGKRVYIINLFA